MGLMGLMGLMGGAIERDALRAMGNLGEHAYRGLKPTAKIWRPYRAVEDGARKGLIKKLIFL